MQLAAVVISLSVDALYYVRESHATREKMNQLSYWEKRGFIANNRPYAERLRKAQKIAFWIEFAGLGLSLIAIPRLSNGDEIVIPIFGLVFAFCAYHTLFHVIHAVLEMRAPMESRGIGLETLNKSMHAPPPQVEITNSRGSAEETSAMTQPDLFPKAPLTGSRYQ